MNQVVLPILAIIIPVTVSIIIYFLQIRRKSLAYRIISVDAILTDTFKEEKMEIKINDREVINPFIVKVQIINNGKKSILDSDFVEDNFGIYCPKSNILGYSIVDKSPEELNINDGLDDGQGNALMIQPLLLNKGDYFTYKLLIDNFDRNTLKISARIKEVKAIEEIKDNRLLDSKLIRLFFLVALIPFSISVLFLTEKILSIILPGWSAIIVFLLAYGILGYFKGRIEIEQ